MPSRTALVHLLGFPGVGKLTIANEMSRLRQLDGGPRLVVVDNHLTANTVFSVIETNGVRGIDPRVWDYVDDVRDALWRAVREISPAGWSFVATNVLLHGDPHDHAAVDRLAGVAAARGGVYLPVRLHCDSDEHRRRVAAPERRERMKWVDPEGVSAFVHANVLLRPDHPELLEMDVTHADAAVSARTILDHVDLHCADLSPTE